jgi:hypothetical protein
MHLTRLFKRTAWLLTPAAAIIAAVVLFSGPVAGTFATPAVPDGEDYVFLSHIGDVVEYDGDWWEITSKLLQRTDINGQIYPWYRLTRPYEGSIQHVWVWAWDIDDEIYFENNGGEGEEGDGDCCPDPPPDCPHPPC